MSSKIIKCIDCGITFVFTVAAQKFYASHNYSDPKRCKKCRELKKQQNRQDRRDSFYR